MAKIRALPNVRRMRHNLTLQTLSESDAANGGITRSWANVAGDDATRRADVQALTGRQFFEAQQTKFEASHRIVTRYVPSLVNAADPTVFRWTDSIATYDILHVSNVDGRNAVTECLCKETSV